jgi:hypothetical protein
MNNREINETRTKLLMKLAEAGRAALEFDPLAASALAAIPDTNPQQYVAAGTLKMIAKMLPTVDAPAVQAPSKVPAEIPAILFDGHAVYTEVMANDPNTPRPTPDNVANVLDAVVRIMRRAGSSDVRDQALEEARAALESARKYIEAASMVQGYGFARPSNPHNFHPDAECCSADEIAAHQAACEAYGKGEYTPERGSEWVGDMHILRAPWGIGSYNDRDPVAEPILAAIDAALKAEAPAASKGGGEHV